jgi:GDPmannose 4,6-dehydratase
MKKVALITGVSGQGGSYLSEQLFNIGYTVHGMIGRSSTFNTDRIEHLRKDPQEKSDFHLHYGDITDSGLLRRILEEVQPHEPINGGWGREKSASA